MMGETRIEGDASGNVHIEHQGRGAQRSIATMAGVLLAYFHPCSRATQSNRALQRAQSRRTMK
jgi:hypothetical protein